MSNIQFPMVNGVVRLLSSLSRACKVVVYPRAR